MADSNRRPLACQSRAGVFLEFKILTGEIECGASCVVGVRGLSLSLSAFLSAACWRAVGDGDHAMTILARSSAAH